MQLHRQKCSRNNMYQLAIGELIFVSREQSAKCIARAPRMSPDNYSLLEINPKTHISLGGALAAREVPPAMTRRSEKRGRVENGFRIELIRSPMAAKDCGACDNVNRNQFRNDS
ncbi:hypothetical protein EVAR_24443_1 [Eumeta japonica]|uniref:Uncharacterized protein n=1 Tax=Eumeta variegata TaxID=151549 RepID=A0A4C1WYP3_EUMVA|nr:hypothetical protein EVAR_24443_1 [Eumeta japonica]